MAPRGPCLSKSTVNDWTAITEADRGCAEVLGAGLRAWFLVLTPAYVTLGNFLSLGLDLLHYKRRGYEMDKRAIR